MGTQISGSGSTIWIFLAPTLAIQNCLGCGSTALVSTVLRFGTLLQMCLGLIIWSWLENKAICMAHYLEKCRKFVQFADFQIFIILLKIYRWHAFILLKIKWLVCFNMMLQFLYEFSYSNVQILKWKRLYPVSYINQIYRLVCSVA